MQHVCQRTVQLPCRPARFPINSARLAKEVSRGRIRGAMRRREYLASESLRPRAPRGRQFPRCAGLIRRPCARLIPFVAPAGARTG